MSSHPIRWGSSWSALRLLGLCSSLALGACGGAPPPIANESSPQAGSTAAATPKPSGDASDSLKQFRTKLASGLAGVSELNLAAKGWGPELASVLAESAALEAVTTLDVSDNDLGVDGARILARTTHLSALRDLDLGGNDIGDDGAIALANAKALAEIETLNVSGNSIAGAGTQALVQGSAKKLSSLDLSMDAIGPAGAMAIGNAHLALTSLYLLGCEIGPSGIKELTRSKHLSVLRVLALSGNSIGDEGVQALAKSSAFANITTLDLCANGVGEAGALALAQSTQLKKLKVLELFGNDVGTRGAAALKKRFGAGLRL